MNYLTMEDEDVRRELAQLQREMNQLTRRTTRPISRRGARVFPSIIISTAKDKLVVRAEVPGMELKGFDISASGGVLTIQGTRLTGDALEGGWYHRRERESGAFSRAVRLPADVDGDKAEATYVAGVLTVLLPLREATKPKEITIKVTEG